MTQINFNQDQLHYKVIRILLMGRNVSGKSLSGNTILGENLFKEHKAEVCDGQTQISGKQVAVIDCPDLLDPDLYEEQLEMMKEQLVSRCSAGLSAVLLTVPLEKPLENEEEILDYIQCLFGPEVQKYIMILFTHKDDLDETIDEHLKHQDHEDLQCLVSECGGKIHCFNNNKTVKGQVQELLQKIDTMMMENGRMFIMEQMRRRHSMVSIVNFSRETPAENEIDMKKDQKTGSGQIGTIIFTFAMITIIYRNDICLDKNMHQKKQECEWLPQSEEQKIYLCSDEILTQTHSGQSLGLFVLIALVIMCFITRKKILRDPESDETLMKGQIYDHISHTTGI
ncbi:GTPase IMAP family member 8-like [Onychostoma macrolepis]|uniref:GTPase IMAP family member 8-like n=1 Tax=Onychostoma macrolepis TaxID=369639 RepID=UPI00272B272F|nr:GTPase IMAP family member 8-like [Onychostoma macrolepis]